MAAEEDAMTEPLWFRDAAVDAAVRHRGMSRRDVAWRR